MDESIASKEQNTDSKPLLDLVGFCGIDDSVNVDELAQLSKVHPWIEWTVLLSPRNQGQKPRLASIEMCHQLGQLTGERQGVGAKANSGSEGQIRLAAHFCHGDAHRLLSGDVDYVQQWYDVLGFHRAQINPQVPGRTGGDWEPKAGAEGLRKVARAFPWVEFILQVNNNSAELSKELFEGSEEAPPNFAAFFDPSMGKGMIPEERTKPWDNIHCGYGGGLDPNTITDQLQVISVACKDYPRTVWIDMESGIRSRTSEEEDIFDLAKVKQVVGAVVAADVVGKYGH